MRISLFLMIFFLTAFLVFIGLEKKDFSKCRSAVLLINDFKIELDVASDDTKRRLGLMFVKDLPKNKGMLFVFDKDDEHTFWMKNTYIPLDILFVSKDFKIEKIATLRSSFFDEEDEKVPKVRGFGRYVIELSSGVSKEYGLKEGMSIELKCIKK